MASQLLDPPMTSYDENPLALAPKATKAQLQVGIYTHNMFRNGNKNAEGLVYRLAAMAMTLI